MVIITVWRNGNLIGIGCTDYIPGCNVFKMSDALEYGYKLVRGSEFCGNCMAGWVPELMRDTVRFIVSPGLAKLSPLPPAGRRWYGDGSVGRVCYQESLRQLIRKGSSCGR